MPATKKKKRTKTRISKKQKEKRKKADCVGHSGFACFDCGFGVNFRVAHGSKIAKSAFGDRQGSRLRSGCFAPQRQNQLEKTEKRGRFCDNKSRLSWI